jgi:hypothetical protein
MIQEDRRVFFLTSWPTRRGFPGRDMAARMVVRKRGLVDSVLSRHSVGETSIGSGQSVSLIVLWKGVNRVRGEEAGLLSWGLVADDSREGPLELMARLFALIFVSLMRDCECDAI